MKKFEIDGQEYEIRSPNTRQRRDAQRLYNKIFKESLEDGCILQAELKEFNKKHGLWSDEDDAELEAKKKEIRELEEKLELGGIELKAAKDIADQIGVLRNELFMMSLKLNQLMDITAEQQAQTSQIDFLISCCVFKDGKPLFKSLDDYYGRLETDPVASLATSEFSAYWYGVNENYSDNFPENRFKKEFGFDKPEEVKPKKKEPFLKNGKPVK